MSSVDDLRKLPVGTAVKAPLDTVAAVEEIDVQGSITRIDGAPAAQVTAEISSPDTGAVSIAVQQEIDLLEAAGQIPAGIDVTLAVSPNSRPRRSAGCSCRWPSLCCWST